MRGSEAYFSPGIIMIILSFLNAMSMLYWLLNEQDR